MRTLLALTFCMTLGSTAVALAGPQDGGAKPLTTGSRAAHVHRLTLYDTDGKAIDPPTDGKPDLAMAPYSPAATCGKCHPVGAISRGWHFNAADPAVAPGRPGEPWFIVDRETQMQLPVSARGWPGTYKPQDIGLAAWEFVKRFGGHTAGGGLGAAGTDADPKHKDPGARWEISGKLEVDCLLCHSATGSHDPAEWSRAIADEDFQWAPTLAAGLGRVLGSAKALSGTPAAPAVDDADPAAAQATVPRGLPLEYDRRKFDLNNRVFFDISRRPPSDRCYYCHTTREVGPGAPERFEADGDVHLRAGMMCADCHRNGIDHRIRRGYEGEPPTAEAPLASALTCRGCHLGTADQGGGAPPSDGGRMGAPRPLHRGLPPIHLEKLTCTACHSGPWPRQQARAVQTAMAHNLGVPSRDRRDDDLPHVVEPVFLREPNNGRIAPHRLVWPAFWARVRNGNVTPLLPAEVRPAVRAARRADSAEAPDGELTEQQIARALADLSANSPEAGPAIYIHNARVFRSTGVPPVIPLRDTGGTPVLPGAAGIEPIAASYAWPIAHDVRPRSQSLGVHGCTDCHAADAPFNAGSVASPFDATATVALPVRTMAQLRGRTLGMDGPWAWSFGRRSAFKLFAFSATGLLGLILLRYTLLAVGDILKRLGGR